MRSLPPSRDKGLYECLFNNKNSDQSLLLLAEGIDSIQENASRLIKDIDLLIANKRYPSAVFLLATADEEIAKAYILLDMCRVDFSRHESTLKKLCQAFYNHVTKHAYNKVIRHKGFLEFKQVKAFWETEMVQWWPAGLETGEPDMPHDTYFNRELPLYVDFIPYNGSWNCPNECDSAMMIGESLGLSRLLDLKVALNQLQETHNASFFKPKSLAMLNEIFSKQYVSDKTSTIEIHQLHENLASRLCSSLGISAKDYYDSALCQWPLYHFVSQ